MKIFNLATAALWLVFIVYWIISARGVKRDIKQESVFSRSYFLVILVVVIFFLSQAHLLRGNFIPQSPTLGFVCVILCVLGIALAIWARIYLGKNWSSFPAIKEGHELVTSGPYRFVRHPIYSGVILALLGTMLISPSIWFVIFICICINYVWRIKKEEEFMTETFGEKYLEYKKKTRALIPFVW